MIAQIHPRLHKKAKKRGGGGGEGGEEGRIPKNFDILPPVLPNLNQQRFQRALESG